MKIKQWPHYLVLISTIIGWIPLCGLSYKKLQSEGDRVPSAGLMVAGYSANKPILEYMYQPPFDFQQTMLLRDVVSTFSAPSSSQFSTREKTNELLKSIIKIDSDEGEKDHYLNNSSALTSESDPLNAVNLDSILEPSVYTTSQAAMARAVIEALGGNLDPIETVDFDKLIQRRGGLREDKFKERQIQAYLARVRAYAAAQSTGLSNLYRLYGARLPIPLKNHPKSIQDKVEVLQKDKYLKAQYNFEEDISPEMLSKIMATRRLHDTAWYDGLVAKDNPTTLLRQIAELLAEQLAESYKLRMNQERILATLSAALLQTNTAIRGRILSDVRQLNSDSSSLEV